MPQKAARVRLDDELRKRAQAAARATHRSLSQLIRDALLAKIETIETPTA